MTRDSIIVEQGPRWLADLLFNPPGWLLAVVVLGIFAVGLVLVDRLAQAGVERDELLQMIQNVLVIVFCGGVTKLLTTRASLPYVIDVGIGVAVGFSAAVVVRRGLDRVLGDVSIPALAS